MQPDATIRDCSLLNVSGEQQLCRMLCIIRLCFYHFFHTIHKIRLAGNNTAGWLARHLLGNLPKSWFKIMYTPEREWKPVRCWKLYKWDKPKGARAMDIKKEVVQCPDPENHKSHKNKETHRFLSGLKLKNTNSTWKIKIDQNCATPYNRARSCSKPKKEPHETFQCEKST